MSFHVPERYRVLKPHPMGSDSSIGNNGAFMVPSFDNSKVFFVIASDELWEHVSVSLKNRCPTWEEMAYIKRMFWGEDVTVVQFHPPDKEYVNNHPYCLHLWRKVGSEFELPPRWMVGV